MHILTPHDMTFYQKEGYLHQQAALPDDFLQGSEKVLQRWEAEIISQWVQDGLIDHPHQDLDFQHRLLHTWEEAGRPHYLRSPRRDLVCPAMYHILVHPVLLDLAADLLGTEEISVHGIFNARPKLPDQKWTNTPWHQDGQYYRDAEHTHVVSMWYPLQGVTEKNSCLQVAPGRHQEALHEGYTDEETGFLGLSPEVRNNLPGRSIEMDRGDILCFPQKMPHRALPNRSDAVRWSMDVRYEPTDQATVSGKDKGFIARSPNNPGAVVSCEEWLRKWEAHPRGTY